MIGLVAGDVVTLHKLSSESIRLVITGGYWERKRFLDGVPHFDYEGKVLQGPDYLMPGQLLRFDAHEVVAVDAERAEVHAGPVTP